MKTRLFSLLAALCLLLTGCSSTLSLPLARELRSTALVGTLGVDLTADGTRMITAAAQGRQKEEITLFTGRGQTLAGAVSAAVSSGSEAVDRTHTGHILLGTGAAESFAETVQDGFRGNQLSTETQIWFLKGSSAAQALAQTDAFDRLETLSAGAEETVPTLTLRQAAAGLSEGEPVLIPAVTLRDGTLEPDGCAVYLAAGGLVLLQGDEALGAALFSGADLQWVEELETENGVGTVRILSADPKVVPVFENGVLSALKVTCRLNAQTEIGAAEDLQPALEARMEGILRAAWTALGKDLPGLRRRVGLSDPLHWDRLLAQWDESGQALELQITVKATLSGSNG